MRKPLLSCLLLLLALRADATHIFGIDLYYTHVTGNTYTINMVIYGDCSGAAFSSLSTSHPVVNLYNGNTFIAAETLTVQAPSAGVEVTPVCPADAGNTTCSNPSNPISGVKKFVYAANVTLSGTSTVWRFLFQGSMGAGTAGRSSGITNITSPGTSLIQLVDTLNNTTYSNSNAVYTTIPTPFFCLGIPANFNPGAVDPDGDSLVYNLVPGIDANTGSSVSYISPYSATAPIDAAAGTFSFSSTTGQLAFTPDLLQKALVVYNVEEYNHGVLRGTSQREMTVVVITPCTDVPPAGAISSPSAGTLSGTTLSLCSSVGPFNFHINPTDPDGDHITMTASGLPAGATMSIVNNGTTAPLGTFSWSTTGLAPGNYNFFVTYQDDGCPLSSKQTLAYTITILPIPSETYSPVSPATCAAKAVFQVTPAGTYIPGILTVIQAGATIQTITPVTGLVTDSLIPGTYTIRLTNPVNCFTDTTITIISPPLPVPSVVTTPPLCPGGSTGSATITAASGLAPYQYANGTGAYTSSGTFTSLSPGSYTLHIKDANNCVKDTTITVPDATRTLLSLNIHKPLCNTFTNGSVIITASNSVAPYTYAMGSGAFVTNDTFASLGAGSYSFHVKNTNGCIVDTTLTLVDSEIIHATLTIVPIACNAGNATVTVNGTGGFGPPYTYAYNTNPFVATAAFLLPAGTYAMHIKDTNACFFDTSVTLTQPTPVAITTAVTNILCNGAATGAVTLAATGGTPAYQYSVGGGVYGSAATFSGLTAGANVFSVKDNNGCIYSDTVTLTQPTAINIDSVKMHQPACYGGTDGSLTIYASGGIPPYTYASGAGTYASASVMGTLAAGTYTLHIKDANGCIKDTTVTLLQPASMIPAALVTKSICHTLGNGKVVLSATNGTSPYTFALGAGTFSASTTFTPLAAGAYTFHVKDANACVKDTIITISDSLLVGGLFTVTAARCFNQPSGTISISGAGGTAPYSYAINTGTYSSVTTFSALITATYGIHIKDANGCKFDTSVFVGQPAVLDAAVSIAPPSCFGNDDGSVTITATGGTPVYTYANNTGGFTTTPTYNALSAGTDSIKVRDANGCLFDTAFAISQPGRIIFSAIAATNISCFGGSDGTLTITAAGATPPYMYAVNSAAWQTGNGFTGLANGTQTIKIKDNNGCEIDTTIALTQPAKLFFSTVDTLNTTCPGYKDGSVTLHAAGGTQPYTYAPDGATFTSGNVFGSLPAGAAAFTVKDANGCTIDTTVTLSGIPQIVVDSATITQPACYGDTNGSFTLHASGGAAPLAYQLKGSARKTAAVYLNVPSGQYSITISDSRSCFIDTMLLVPQPDSITITDSVTPNNCYGVGDHGIINAFVTGGTSPYTYLWSDSSQTSAGIANLPNGRYTVLVKDANNCTDSSTSVVDYDDCCTPFLPNAFTPNGDGRNELYRFRFVGDMFIVRFSIYNRFGEEVFTMTNSKDLDKGWDGKYKGVPAEMGVYYYYAKIVCGNKGDHIKELKGDVTLVR